MTAWSRINSSIPGRVITVTEDDRLYCPDCHDSAELLHEEGGERIYSCSNQHYHSKEELLTREQALDAGDSGGWGDRLGL